VQKDIDYTPIYLVRFFRNLLLGEKWDLKNRYLHIEAAGKWGSQGMVRTEDGGVKDENGGVSGGVNLEEVLLKAVVEHPGSNAPTLSKIVQKSLRTVQRYLKRLADKCKIEFRGAPKTGGYWPLDMA